MSECWYPLDGMRMYVWVSEEEARILPIDAEIMGQEETEEYRRKQLARIATPPPGARPPRRWQLPRDDRPVLVLMPFFTFGDPFEDEEESERNNAKQTTTQNPDGSQTISIPLRLKVAEGIFDARWEASEKH